MANRRSSPPSYRLHRQSGQAVVTLTCRVSGKRRDVLLGEHNTPESRVKYAEVIAAWERDGRVLDNTPKPAPIRHNQPTVAEVMFDHLEAGYKRYGITDPDGRLPSRLYAVRSVVRITRAQAVRLDRYPVKPGVCEFHRDVLYRQHDPLKQHVVIHWPKQWPGKRQKKRRPKPPAEAWYLMTNLDPACGPKQKARRISDLYARRFDIEELFRDAKSEQFGYALGKTRITRPDRFDRLLLILVLAYLLLVGLGLWAKRNLPPSRWASNNRRDECSAFTIGRLLLDQRPTSRHRLLRELLAHIRRLGRNWG